ncbi:MAG: adenylosuccinate lyase, partial [Planctomycetes bacterium]|nr:adenylosuccinate lyase [Planctomycetota bacterium]
MEDHNSYSNPLVDRYASRDMVYLFSGASRYSTWRRLWALLAREQQKLGLPITNQQLADLDAHINDIDYEAVSRYEKDMRHDVMAHGKAYGDVAPSAAGIIHLGATSCFITDNADLILQKQACELLAGKLCALLQSLADFCRTHRSTPCLGWTHFQPAQLTTVGKRGCLWAQDLLMDLNDLMDFVHHLRMRGIKGATGTQASFMDLFNGNFEKVKQLDQNIARQFGFIGTIPVTGQTYTRKIDEKMMSILSRLAGSASKFANDIRLLMNLREVSEPFGKKQIGSSAMAYKRNPMRSERINSLSRFVQSQFFVLQQTAATQWLERTLDDSACRRLAIPQAFLGIDAVLTLYFDIISELHVHEKEINSNLNRELPFMCTEKILMECVRRGGNRQELHEAIRQHSMVVKERMEEGQGCNDLILRLKEDPLFASVKDEIDEWIDPMRFVGAAPLQVKDFLQLELEPQLDS